MLVQAANAPLSTVTCLLLPRHCCAVKESIRDSMDKASSLSSSIPPQLQNSKKPLPSDFHSAASQPPIDKAELLFYHLPIVIVSNHVPN